MSNKLVSSYSPGSKILHWVIALIVITMLTGSFFIESLPKEYIGSAFMWHKSFGITVLFLMLLRLVWIVIKGKPALPVTVPAWERIFSHIVHYALYFFVILMPICGWIMSMAGDRIPNFFGLIKLPLPWISPNKELAELMAQAHNTIAWIIIALLILHIAGALKHHFINKDKVLRRMLPGG